MYIYVRSYERGDLVFAVILFLTFVVARILYGIFYAAKFQPWRTVVFGVGAIVTV